MANLVELPSYEQVHLDRAPTLSAIHSQMTLTFDPTATSIKPLAAEEVECPVFYSLTSSLLRVKMGSAIQVQRVESRSPGPDGNPRTKNHSVYAIGDRFMNPLSSRRLKLQGIQVARSHGLFVSTKLRKLVWEFSTEVKPRQGDVVNDVRMKGPVGTVDPVYSIGTGVGVGTIKKPLLQFFDSKWVSFDAEFESETIAFEREGTEESQSMPTLSVVKNLDEEMMDLLVSAWCVRLWGDLPKMVSSGKRRSSRS